MTNLSIMDSRILQALENFEEVSTFHIWRNLNSRAYEQANLGCAFSNGKIKIGWVDFRTIIP